MRDLGHAARLLGLLGLAVEELEQASAALLEDVRREEGRTEQGERIAMTVHLRVETVHALARLAVERLGGPPDLAEALRPDRDFHVLLGDGFVASILAESGDAQIAPFGKGLDAREILERLEARFRSRA